MDRACDGCKEQGHSLSPVWNGRREEWLCAECREDAYEEDHSRYGHWPWEDDDPSPQRQY